MSSGDVVSTIVGLFTDNMSEIMIVIGGVAALTWVLNAIWSFGTNSVVS